MNLFTRVLNKLLSFKDDFEGKCKDNSKVQSSKDSRPRQTSLIERIDQADDVFSVTAIASALCIDSDDGSDTDGDVDFSFFD